MPFCPNCGTDVGTSRFCPNCGAEQGVGGSAEPAYGGGPAKPAYGGGPAKPAPYYPPQTVLVSTGTQYNDGICFLLCCCLSPIAALIYYLLTEH